MSLRTPRLAPEEAAFRPALALRFLPGLYGADMPKMSYSEQLKHPNWQRKRLEVLERAKFRCEVCNADDKTLHVHHKQYFKGRMAWEYDADGLVALCEPCHAQTHEAEEDLKEVLASLATDGPRNINDARALVAGWTRGHEDVPCAFRLASTAPVAAVAGMIARQLCEVVGWSDGGLAELMTFGECLQDDGFVAAMRETMREVGNRPVEEALGKGY